MSPEDDADDGAALNLLATQRPEYLAAWSRVELLATPELLELQDDVSDEIDAMQQNISLVTSDASGGDILDVYIGEGDPVAKAVLAFQSKAISEVRESD